MELLIQTIGQDTPIYRMREFWGFYNPQELSYCPVDKCNRMQRASLCHQTVFYGAISAEKYPRPGSEYIVLCEGSKLIKEKHADYLTEKVTIGEWTVINPIELVCIVHEDVFKIASNVLLDDIKRDYERLRTRSASAISIQKYLAQEFSKEVAKDVDSYLYQVSASYSNIIMQDTSYAGIIYPPVGTEGNAGMNVAISPFVASSSMRLRKIHEIEIFRHQLHAEVVSRRVFEYPSFKVVYEDKRSADEIWNRLLNKS